MAKIQTEIFIETHKTHVFKRKRYFVRAYCELCGREVSLLPPGEAAFLTGQETEKIHSLVATGKIHFRYFNEQKLFVCLTSLCLI